MERDAQRAVRRELSKSMDGASMAQVTEMYRVIDFVLEMKTLGLRMVPIFNDDIWKLEALSDSDIANTWIVSSHPPLKYHPPFHQ